VPPPRAAIVAFSRGQSWVLRRTGGRLWRRYKGRPVLLLTTHGRRSGRPRTTPLAFVRDGDTLVAAGSNAGRDDDPAWILNLRSNPNADVWLAGRTAPARARFATNEERDRLWKLLVAHSPGFARYAARTERAIPVVVLRPKPAFPPGPDERR